MAREAIRVPIRLRLPPRRTLRERVALRFPSMIRLGGVVTLRLPHRSRLRRALLVHAARLVIEAQSRGDFELTVSIFGPRGELRTFPTGGATVAILGLEEVYRGPDGIRRFFEQWADPWEEWHWDEEGELLDLGRGELLALLRLVGRGRGSGIEVREQVALLARFEGGRAVRQRNWLGSGAWDEARRAAGLV